MPAKVESSVAEPSAGVPPGEASGVKSSAKVDEPPQAVVKSEASNAGSAESLQASKAQQIGQAVSLSSPSSEQSTAASNAVDSGSSASMSSSTVAVSPPVVKNSISNQSQPQMSAESLSQCDPSTPFSTAGLAVVGGENSPSSADQQDFMALPFKSKFTSPSSAEDFSFVPQGLETCKLPPTVTMDHLKEKFSEHESHFADWAITKISTPNSKPIFYNTQIHRSLWHDALAHFYKCVLNLENFDWKCFRKPSNTSGAIDVYTLYVEALEKNGYHAICSQGLWLEMATSVCENVQPADVHAVADHLKRQYEVLLLGFELWQTKNNLVESIPMPQLDMAASPIEGQDVMLPVVRKYMQKSNKTRVRTKKEKEDKKETPSKAAPKKPSDGSKTPIAGTSSSKSVSMSHTDPATNGPYSGVSNTPGASADKSTVSAPAQTPAPAKPLGTAVRVTDYRFARRKLVNDCTPTALMSVKKPQNRSALFSQMEEDEMKAGVKRITRAIEFAGSGDRKWAIGVLAGFALDADRDIEVMKSSEKHKIGQLHRAFEKLMHAAMDGEVNSYTGEPVAKKFATYSRHGPVLLNSGNTVLGSAQDDLREVLAIFRTLFGNETTAAVFAKHHPNTLIRLSILILKNMVRDEDLSVEIISVIGALLNAVPLRSIFDCESEKGRQLFAKFMDWFRRALELPFGRITRATCWTLAQTCSKPDSFAHLEMVARGIVYGLHRSLTLSASQDISVLHCILVWSRGSAAMRESLLSGGSLVQDLVHIACRSTLFEFRPLAAEALANIAAGGNDCRYAVRMFEQDLVMLSISSEPASSWAAEAIWRSRMPSLQLKVPVTANPAAPKKSKQPNIEQAGPLASQANGFNRPPQLSQNHQHLLKQPQSSLTPHQQLQMQQARQMQMDMARHQQLGQQQQYGVAK